MMLVAVFACWLFTVDFGDHSIQTVFNTPLAALTLRDLAGFLFYLARIPIILIAGLYVVVVGFCLATGYRKI